MVDDYRPKKRLEMDNETIFYEESSVIKVPKSGSEIQVQNVLNFPWLENSGQNTSNNSPKKLLNFSVVGV